MYLLISQVDPISGGAGWVGAGLLGLVLGWLLLKHLPDKDRTVRELVTDCDKHNARIVISFQEQLKEQRAEFRDALTFVATEAEKRTAVLIDTMRNEVKTAVLVMQAIEKHNQKVGGG